MAAPALVALAHGSRDPRSAATIKALVDEVRALRPDLRIETAFLDLSKPSLAHGRRPARRAPGTTRSWSSRCCSPTPTTPRSTSRPPWPRPTPGTRASRSAPPRSSASRRASSRCSTCGCARRCKAARVRELDALVLAAAGSSDPLANQAVARLARLWGTHHKLPVTAAFASAAPPATGEAVRAFREEGRRHIAVASLFLAPGFLPDRAAELALEAGAVAVSEPLGAHPEPWPARSWPATPSARSSWSRSSRRTAPAGARAGGRGRRSTPPCTGPGWRTVLRGALRKPKRWPTGCPAAAPTRASPRAHALDERQRVADRVEVEPGVEGARAARGRRCQATSRKSASSQ